MATLPVCTLWHRTQHLVDTPQAVAFVIDLLCKADRTLRETGPHYQCLWDLKFNYLRALSQGLVWKQLRVCDTLA